MKYDVIVIGGGLSGMLTAIALQSSGKKTAVISAGESTMYFSKGAVRGHLSEENIKTLEGLGVKLYKGGYRLTPAGEFVKEDFMFSPCSALESTNLAGKTVTVFNFAGFADFPTSLVAAGLEKCGAKCTIKELRINGLESSRENLTEFRSTTIARELEANPALVEDVIAQVATADGLKVLPAVFYSGAQQKVIDAVGEVLFAGTLPPTAPAFALSKQLKETYVSRGGYIYKGERAIGSDIVEGKVEAVYCERLADEPLRADTYVLATGSFFSKGLVSNYNRIWEPVFGLDTNASADRKEWLDENFWADQPYRRYGVELAEGCKGIKDGTVIENLYVVGSVAGSGSEHWSITTALKVVENIIKEK